MRVSFGDETLVAATKNVEHVARLETPGRLHVSGHVEYDLAHAADLARAQYAQLDLTTLAALLGFGERLAASFDAHHAITPARIWCPGAH